MIAGSLRHDNFSLRAFCERWLDSLGKRQYANSTAHSTYRVIPPCNGLVALSLVVLRPPGQPVCGC